MVTKLICIALLSALGIALSACTMEGSINKDFAMSGSAEGLRAFNDGLVGIARTAKEPEDKDNQYLGYRKEQESELTKRLIGAKSFMRKIFGAEDSAPEQNKGS